MLPEIVETKETLGGARKQFRCRLIDHAPGEMTLLFVSTAEAPVHGLLTLPAGTVTFGHFWSDRPYNVYHWMTPEGRTLAYYFNLADGTRLTPDALSWRDLTVDVLVSPTGDVAVLDEHELPPDLDPTLRDRIDAARREVVANAAALTAEIERRSRALWPRVFGGGGAPA